MYNKNTKWRLIESMISTNIKIKFKKFNKINNKTGLRLLN